MPKASESPSARYVPFASGAWMTGSFCAAFAAGAKAMAATAIVSDFAALHDLQQARATRKRLTGIQDAVTTPIDWLMKGLPVRGVQTRLYLDQNAFLCEGERRSVGRQIAGD